MNAIKIAALGWLLWVPASAQFTSSSCPGGAGATLAPSDFTFTELAKGSNSVWNEPVSFDLQGVYNAAGDSVTQVNMFFAERTTGNVMYYDGATGKLSVAGTIPTYGQTHTGEQDNGLMGVVVDPNYNTDRFIYVWFSAPIANPNDNRRMRLARIKVNADNTLNMSSEQIMIDILESKSDQWHTGGPMQFDSYGDLWGTMGNNSTDVDPAGDQIGSTDSSNTAMWGPPNTASLRGGIWRIHPDTTATSVDTVGRSIYGPGYTIPAGNFGDYWATQFQSQGLTGLAAEYRNPKKVLPEIYVKGERSNFSLHIDAKKRWLTWGTVNYNSDADEFNLVTHPAFTGMPFWEGNNRQLPWPSGYSNNLNMPTNFSPFNSGVDTLPPATPSVFACCSPMSNNTAMGGPIYEFNPYLKNRGKLPPHFNNYWFNMNFQASTIWTSPVDTTNPTAPGTPVQLSGTGKLWANLPLRSPLSIKVGPDGAMYILNYDGYYSTMNPSVARVTYTGSCVVVASVAVKPKITEPEVEFSVTQNDFWIGEQGPHEFSLYDLQGHRLVRLLGTGPTQYSFADLHSRYQLKAGIYLARLQTTRGTLFRKISMF